jgi:hypothetical protein
MTAALKPWLIRSAAWGAVLAVLAGVLMLYLRPDFMVMLADQIWACF